VNERNLCRGAGSGKVPRIAVEGAIKDDVEPENEHGERSCDREENDEQ
jgi:hypothetical protein